MTDGRDQRIGRDGSDAGDLADALAQRMVLMTLPNLLVERGGNLEQVHQVVLQQTQLFTEQPRQLVICIFEDGW